MILIDILDDSL